MLPKWQSDSDSALEENQQEETAIFRPITLPCGQVVQNRLVKVAMYEHLASFLGGPPNAHHLRLYSEWAKHDWGIVITGNVQIVEDHLTLGRDIVLPRSYHHFEENLQPFKNLADAIHGLRSSDIGTSVHGPNKTLAIMQLNHPGRQSSNFIGGRPPFRAPLAPSAISLGTGINPSFASTIVHSVMFQTPKEMTELDIEDVVAGFVGGASLAQKSRFDGIQLHAAHGYLLSQFLSSKANVRTDKYCVDKTLDIFYRIVRQIRQSTKYNFVISIKLNAVDYIQTELSKAESLTEAEERALGHLITIADWGLVDVIEISGGDYEKPDFMTSDSDLTSSRQAFFSRFSQQALKTLHTRKGPVPLILLTGGLRTPHLLRSALACGHADLLGIGRGSVVCPDLPSALRERLQNLHRWDDIPFQPGPALNMPWIITCPPFSWLWSIMGKVKLIGAGVTMAWYIVAMRELANSAASGKGYKPDYRLGGLQSIFWMWAWTTDGMKPVIYLIVSCLVALLLALSLQISSHS